MTLSHKLEIPGAVGKSSQTMRLVLNVLVDAIYRPANWQTPQPITTHSSIDTFPSHLTLLYPLHIIRI